MTAGELRPLTTARDQGVDRRHRVGTGRPRHQGPDHQRQQRHREGRTGGAGRGGDLAEGARARGVRVHDDRTSPGRGAGHLTTYSVALSDVLRRRHGLALPRHPVSSWRARAEGRARSGAQPGRLPLAGTDFPQPPVALGVGTVGARRTHERDRPPRDLGGQGDVGRAPARQVPMVGTNRETRPTQTNGQTSSGAGYGRAHRGAWRRRCRRLGLRTVAVARPQVFAGPVRSVPGRVGTWSPDGWGIRAAV